MPFHIISGDITRQICDAIVNPTDAAYSGGGGADRAIHRAAGPKLHEVCDKLPALSWGQSALTKGYDLPAKWVIHTAGPVWVDGKHDERLILSNCYQSALRIAAENDFQSVAFPLIAAGTCGFPKEEALSIAVDEIRRFLQRHEMEITLVVYDRKLYRIDPQTASGVDRFLNERFSIGMRPQAKNNCEEHEDAFANNLPTAREDARTKAAKLPRPFHRPSPPPMPTASYSQAPAASLADQLRAMDESFSDAVLRLVDERGMTDAQCYKRANISKQVFSKLRSNNHYKPSKSTALALAVALELDLEGTRSLLNKAGMSLSHSLMMDVIVEYFIRQHQFDVMVINETLYQYDQPLLGAK